MKSETPSPPRVLDGHDRLAPFDPAGKVLSFERWIPLARETVLVGSNGDPLRPAWASFGGLVVYQVTRRWQTGRRVPVSARLWSALGQPAVACRGAITVEAIVEVDDHEYFRLGFVPNDGAHATNYRNFIRAALTAHARQRRPFKFTHGSSPANAG